ncbi:hypothetical protein FKW77_008624 [Venturia effusa]|uniref:Uncharacterized protein n=1 Tax=Venturia effusa TaxID=50376 RepID=A0A517L1U4_9PEZI|nr:hypothetical protein FKW77_008624 [Venturia effusa]
MPLPKNGTKFTVRSEDITMGRNGTFLAFRGNLLDGGTSMRATINGQEFCRSDARYDSGSATAVKRGIIQATQYCNRPVRVTTNDVIVFEANYDLGLHPRQTKHER